MVDCKINPNAVRINFTIYQLNKSTIEFYLPYEDVQNALKESAQTPFIRTKDEWTIISI